MALFGQLPFNPQQHPIKRFIESFELENIPYQEVPVDNLHFPLNIEAQGDGIYLYAITTDDPFPTKFEPIKIWIMRNGDSFLPSDIKGQYVKTIVIKNIAYHFFSNYKFNPQ